MGDEEEGDESPRIFLRRLDCLRFFELDCIGDDGDDEDDDDGDDDDGDDDDELPRIVCRVEHLGRFPDDDDDADEEDDDQEGREQP